MRRCLWWFSLACWSAACGKTDNSGVTARAEWELHAARDQVVDHTKEVASSQAALDQEQRDLEQAKTKVAADSKSLEQKQQQLGSAQDAALAAQTAYSAALVERLAKLDADLAKLATKTDAASKDAYVGLAARRAQIDPKLPVSSTADWTAQTGRLNVALSAIEKDLHAAL